MFGGGLRSCLAVFVVVIFLSACAEEISESEHIARARDYVSEADYSSASIELRNVIRQSPDNMDARLLLGQVYFEIGDMLSAEKELLRVQKDNPQMESNTLKPLLARVWVMLGRNEQALSIDVDGLEEESVASILATQAILHMSLSEVEQATQKMELALELSPDSTIVLNAQARFKFFNREMKAADELLTALHERDPDDASLWALHGDVRRSMGDFNKADEYYSMAISLDSTLVGMDYRMRRTFLRIQEKQFDEAQLDLDFLLQHVPQNTQVNYAQGLVFFFNRKYEEAISSFVVAESDKFRFPELLMYLGLAHYQVGNFDQAYGYAQDFYALVSDNSTGNKLLSTLYVLNGKYVEAEQLVQVVLAKYPNDIEALNILANALSNQLRMDEAIDVLARIVELDPESARAQVRLSVGYTRAGRSEEAVELIQNAIVLDPQFDQADVVLVLTHLRENDFESALQAAQSFQQRNPGDVAPLLLMGRVYTSMGNADAASQAYMEVLELDPGNPSANHKLAAMAIIKKDMVAARGYYGAVLKAHPHYLSTLTAFAFLEGSENNPEAMMALLEEAIDAHPEAIPPRIVLARYHMTTGRPDKVPVILSGLSDAQKNTPLVLRLMGKAQLAEEKYGDARYSFERLIDLEKGRATAEDHQLLGLAYRGLGDKEKMDFHMQKSVALNPNSVDAHLVLAANAFSRADAEELERELAAVAKLSPDNPQMLQLSAAYARVQGDQEQALSLFKKIFESEPSTVNMLNLLKQYKIVGDQLSARNLLESWLKTNTTDIAARMALASEYLAIGDTEHAVQEYTRVLEGDKNNLVALNNLAWSLKDDNPKLALQYAEQAVEIAGSSLVVLDTLAIVQSENGQYERAEHSIEQVLKAAPENSSYLFHSALIASQSGKREEAVNILQGLLSSNMEFAERDEASQLMKSLSVE